MGSAPFVTRHNGPRPSEVQAMLARMDVPSLEALVDRVVPAGLRMARPLDLPEALSEAEALDALRGIAEKNQVFRSYLGMGYHGTFTPPVIQRNILENPGWYTAYTPYQAEIAQGRLEALLLFEMMVQDLTGFEISNASLLDEATAAAEAMAMAARVVRKSEGRPFVVDHRCHPQTRAVVETRAEALGWEVHVLDVMTADFQALEPFGVLVQDPTTDGEVRDLCRMATAAKEAGAFVIAAVDLLSLTLREGPASWGADAAVGSAQRFGVPMGYGGPHAAYVATTAKFARKMPGRIIGVSKDADGKVAYRMALQTREQHIRRAKATSNVCTAQVLLAVIAAMYAVWHGPDGLAAIARQIRQRVSNLSASLQAAGITVETGAFFDTIAVRLSSREAADEVLALAARRQINLRDFGDGRVGIALDETVTCEDVGDILDVFGVRRIEREPAPLPEGVARTSPFLQHPAFFRYRSETEMLRYLHRLQARDLSLTTSMIPLGSCTMKLNATAEMMPVTMPGFGALHPFVPVEQARGYESLHHDLQRWLAEITGFSNVSLQPNAGSQGEYAGLLVIRAYHQARGEGHRDVCLIPTSAHGTNPASASMAGMKVVEVACAHHGTVAEEDHTVKAAPHEESLAALMVTYPSTHGVFEEEIKTLCETVHEHGGQVYMDGANLNAMVGLCRPGDLGADVCHLNLHKTFTIPHGGGGPGMGPIGVGAHLAPFLPGHPVVQTGGAQAIGPISAAPWGSPSILPISWAYIAMMGPDGLTEATRVALLNANYIACRLRDHYPVLYTGRHGFIAHECILDCRSFKAVGIEVDDISKRLMDHGFHGPTMSWPVAGTLMVEPTESESKEEIDRFCDAMIAIREEIRDIEEGRVDRSDSPLVYAPHTAQALLREGWDRPYAREVGAYPSDASRRHKFWPAVSRVDNVYGDKNLLTRLPEDMV